MMKCGCTSIAWSSRGSSPTRPAPRGGSWCFRGRGWRSWSATFAMRANKPSRRRGATKPPLELLQVGFVLEMAIVSGARGILSFAGVAWRGSAAKLLRGRRLHFAASPGDPIFGGKTRSFCRSRAPVRSSFPDRGPRASAQNGAPFCQNLRVIGVASGCMGSASVARVQRTSRAKCSGSECSGDFPGSVRFDIRSFIMPFVLTNARARINARFGHRGEVIGVGCRVSGVGENRGNSLCAGLPTRHGLETCGRRPWLGRETCHN
jgi:hypothetical protein